MSAQAVRGVLAGFVVVVVLGGCLEGSSPREETAPTGAPGVGDAPALPVPAGAADGPAWQVGQWWRWKLEAAPAESAYEATTVVLAADPVSFDVGSPDAQAAGLVYPFHLVGFGSVPRASLAWQAHGSPVQFLRFPIVDGDSWTSDFWSAPGATVTVRNATVQGPGGPEPGYRSEVTYAGGGVFLAASWSMQRSQFVQVQSFFGGEAPFASAILVDEGKGGQDGKPFVVTDLLRTSSNPTAPQPPASFTVPAGADLLLMACFLGGGPGRFDAVVSPPGGAPATCGTVRQDASLFYQAYTVPVQQGAGQAVLLPAGQGGVTLELFAVTTQA